MKQLLLLAIAVICICSSAFSQAPQTIPYQAVARDASGNLLQNTTICVQFRIYNAASGGTLIYEEHQQATTNKLGLFTSNVGTGNYDGGSSASFSAINWGNTTAFIEIGLDVTSGCSGSNTYTTMGRSQMMSVPFALYAGSAASASGAASGDLTGTYPAPTIAANKVTYNKIQTETNATILGNNSGSAASPEEISLGTGLGFSGASLVNTAPDKTVSITGTGITVGGAYPNFTVATNNNGTVTGTGTANQVTYFSSSSAITGDASNTFTPNNSGAAALAVTNNSTTAGSKAISGSATGASGATYGVYGQSASTTGYGVYGTATATGGIGGYFSASGASGYAMVVPSGGGSVGIGTVTPATTLDVNGTVNAAATGGYYLGGAGSPANIELIRNVPNVVNSEIEIGNFSVGNGAHNLHIAIAVSNGSFSVSKMYDLAVEYNATNNVWYQVSPTVTTGQFGNNDFALDINSTGNTAYFRIRRTLGTTDGSTSGGTGARVRIESAGSSTDVFTATSATAAVSAPTSFYGNTGPVQANNLAGTGYRPVIADPDGNLITISGSSSNKATFNYTGAAQSWTVPSGVSLVFVKLWGAGGGSAYNNGDGAGGGGGFVSGFLPIPSGTTSLTVVVGQGGIGGTSSSATSGTPSTTGTIYGGGGQGGHGYSGTGGGRTAIQFTAGTDIVTAGGGGGGGRNSNGFYGGAGGGLVGGCGCGSQTFNCGGGGYQTNGGTTVYNGTGGTYAPAGTQYQGGKGYARDGSGGGGGGYYGGAGGGSSNGDGGGGGGSSYISNLVQYLAIRNEQGGTTNDYPNGYTLVTNIILQPGGTDGPDYTAGVGVGGYNSTVSTGIAGGNGKVVISW